MSSRSSSSSDSFDKLSDSEFSDSEHSGSYSEIVKDSESNFELKDFGASEVQSQKNSETDFAPRNVTLIYEGAGGTKTQVTLALTRILNSEDSDNSDSELTEAQPIEVRGYRPDRQAREAYEVRPQKDSESNAGLEEKTSKDGKQQKVEQLKKQGLPWRKILRLFVFSFVLFLIGTTLDYFIENDSTPPMDIGKLILQFEKQRLIKLAKKEREVLEHSEKLRELKKKFNQREFAEKVSFNRWVPDPSRFEGVEELLKRNETGAAQYEEFFYLYSPIAIKLNRDSSEIVYNFVKDHKRASQMVIDGCQLYRKKACHQTKLYVWNGDLHVYETIKSKYQDHHFLRVYYIPSDVLLDMGYS